MTIKTLYRKEIYCKCPFCGKVNQYSRYGNYKPRGCKHLTMTAYMPDRHADNKKEYRFTFKRVQQ